MKNIFIAFLFALLFHTNSYAQSLQETENWILSKIPFYQPLDLKYSFDNGNLIRKFAMPLSTGGKKTKNVIPLKDVKTISVTIGDDFISYRLKCENDCNYEELSTNEGDFISEEMLDSFLFEIYFEGNFDKSLAPRVEKALLKLVELNGGKAKIVPRENKKEPF